MSIVIEAIKEIMQEKGITVYQLSKHTDISQQTLHNIMERGDLKLSQLISITQVLGISASKLLDDAGNMEGVTIDMEKMVAKTSKKEEVEYLKELLQEKERVIDMQQEVISLLKNKAG